MKPRHDTGRTDCQKLKPAVQPLGHLSAPGFFQRLHLTMRVLHRQSWRKFAKYLRRECQELFQSPSRIDRGRQPEDRSCSRRQQFQDYFLAPNNSSPVSGLRFPERHQPPKQLPRMQPTNDSPRNQSQHGLEYQSDAACCPSSRRAHFGL